MEVTSFCESFSELGRVVAVELLLLLWLELAVFVVALPEARKSFGVTRS
jgi:hypothetical protein